MIINFSVEPRQIQKTTIAYMDIEKEKFPLVCMGKDSYIVSSTIESGINLSKDGVHNLQIGKFCSIAHNVSFVIDLNHDYHNIMMGDSDLIKITAKSSLKRKGEILIQNDVCIGRGATIMSGVTIHNGALIAANYHVVKDVPPYAIVVGNPARIIGYRFDDDIINKLLQIQWWYWDDEMIRNNNYYFNLGVSDFCDRFYKSDLINIEEENIEMHKLESTYLYFLDLNEPWALWGKVIREFIVNFKEDLNKQLLLFVDEKLYLMNKDAVEYVSEYINKIINEHKAECTVTLCIENKNKDRIIFRYADYFITNRSEDTVRYLGYANLYNVQILSGVDILTFEV